MMHATIWVALLCFVSFALAGSLLRDVIALIEESETWNPKANPNAIVTAGNARFTVLTS